jgi:transcriptional regulator with XRE-family HTH domain
MPTEQPSQLPGADPGSRSYKSGKQEGTKPLAPELSRQEKPRPINNRRVYNRVAAFMQHVTWYGCRSQARLAADAGVSEAALSRFIANQSNPSYALVEAVCGALEQRLKQPIPPRELVSMDGNYPTPSVCDFLGCRGCTPRAVYESEEFSTVKPGQFRFGAAATADPTMGREEDV